MIAHLASNAFVDVVLFITLLCECDNIVKVMIKSSLVLYNSFNHYFGGNFIQKHPSRRTFQDANQFFLSTINYKIGCNYSSYGDFLNAVLFHI